MIGQRVLSSPAVVATIGIWGAVTPQRPDFAPSLTLQLAAADLGIGPDVTRHVSPLGWEHLAHGPREELVAELGSAFLAADLGLYPEPREDHAAYLESWIKVLQDDKRAIVSAAAHSERAVNFLHGLQPGEAAP